METNKIYNEECIEGMKERIPDNSIDMVLADLPYGTTVCDWDSIIPLEPLWEQYKRIGKNDTPYVLTGTEPFSSQLRMSNINQYRYDWVWEKERPTNIFFMKNQVGKVHEIISVFYENQPTYNPQMEDRVSNNEGERNLKEYNNNGSKTHKRQEYEYADDYDSSKRYPRSVLKINREQNNYEHPTQKPVALFEYLIKTYTNEGDVVLDNVMGSGTTAVACLKTNRKFIGFEQDEDYYNTAIKRIGEFDKDYYDELTDEAEQPEQEQLF